MEEKIEELLEEVRSIRRAFQIYLEKEDQPSPPRHSVFTPHSSTSIFPQSEVEIEGPFEIFENVYMSGIVMAPPQNRFRASLAKIKAIGFDVFINLSKSNFESAVNEHFPKAKYHHFLHEDWNYDQVFEVVEIMKKNRKKKVLVTSFYVKDHAARICLCYLVHIGKTSDEALQIYGGIVDQVRRQDEEEIVEWMESEKNERPPSKTKRRKKSRKK